MAFIAKPFIMGYNNTPPATQVLFRQEQHSARGFLFLRDEK